MVLVGIVVAGVVVIGVDMGDTFKEVNLGTNGGFGDGLVKVVLSRIS